MLLEVDCIVLFEMFQSGLFTVVRGDEGRVVVYGEYVLWLRVARHR